jgi:NTP pyrophosphatase (non-canonical NTP hydrolase)
MISLKHTIASARDTKTTILNSEIQKLVGKDYKSNEITLYYNDYNCSIKYHSSRGGTTWYADISFPKIMTLPRLGQPIFYNVSYVKPHYTPPQLKLDLQPIRDWAKQRGLYDKGDSKTQTIKLMEEVGELSKAILKQDKAEIIDGIGDIVVVLTNLAHLEGLKVEECIKMAYAVIVDRKGVMVNGTFVKDGSKL